MGDTESFYTCGNFKTEDDACESFDDIIEKLGCFHMYKEISGKYISTPHFKSIKEGARIDRILLPRKELLDLGLHGAIGVEIKKNRHEGFGVVFPINRLSPGRVAA